jgi:hypothetical protein
LPEHIRTLIEASVMPTFAELTEQWLLEQVEAGKLIWLNNLANAAPELAEPFLIEHSASMDLTQRLMLVTTQPRDDDLFVVQDAWRLLMDAAWCKDCGPPLDPDLPEALVFALMSMSGEEPARMLRDLLDGQAIPDFDINKHNIGIQALTSNEPAMQRLGLDLAEKHADIPLIPYSFPALHANAPDRLSKLAEQRLESWNSNKEQEQIFAGQVCEAVGLAFYIDPTGRRYDWREMLNSVSESELTWAGSGCSIWLGQMVSIDNHDVDRLDLITETYLEQGMGVDAWTYLMRVLRHEITELERLNLTAALLDTPIWGELDDSWREWLLGERVRSGKASSCESDSVEEL